MDTITPETTGRQNVRYSSMSQYLQASVAQGQTQSQTILGDNEERGEDDLNLNQNFVDSDREEEAPPRQATFSTRNILSSSSIKQKSKVRRLRDRRVTINVINKDDGAYRCVLRDNTRELVKEFSFVTEKDFFKLMEEDEGELFEIFKHLLAVYQELDKAAEDLQLKMNMISTEKTRLENRINAQKLKIDDFFKKRQKSLNRENESTRLLKVRENEVDKLRRSRNAHRENFEKVDVKIRSLIMNKKNMQKIIEELKRKLKHAKIYISLDSNQKNAHPSVTRSDRRTQDHVNSSIILRRGEISASRIFESRRYENEPSSSSKHKYSELFLFYENATKWKTWKAHLITKVQTDYYDFSSKWHKINYARDKTRENAQTNIWHKAKSDTVESYNSLKKLMQDLKNVYEKEKQDKHKTLLQQLFSSSFVMRAKDRFEIFEKFLERFTFIISSLRLEDNEKITHLFRNLSKHLTEKIYHLNEVTTYAKYVKEMRQTANQMKVRSDMKQFTISLMSNVRSRNFRQVDIARKKIFLKKFIRERFKAEKQAIVEEVLMRLSVWIRIKFRKNERCFKCEAKRHIATDINVSCKDKNQITREKAEILLSEMNIKWTKANFEYFENADTKSEYIENEFQKQTHHVSKN